MRRLLRLARRGVFTVGERGMDRMEEELKCPVCRRIYTNPVLMPCSHSLCLTCATSLQTPVQQLQTGGEENNGTVSEYGDFPDVDKLSLLSETDSGVVVSSRPNSYVGTPSIGSLFFQLQGNSLGINCPTCKRNIYLDDNGANSLPKNRVLQAVVDKYGENKQLTTYCQLCEGGSTTPATLMCEQCEVFYCDQCRDGCHPDRGPLAQHNLVPPADGKALLRAKHKSKESKCSEHVDENLSMYCVLCRVTVCYVCVQDGRHINHDVQALGAMCKSQKTELSQLLQALSEKARSGTEFIQRLKGMSERITDNCLEFEASVVAQCDALINAIRLRKAQLLENIKQEQEHKNRVFKEQLSHCTQKLQRTTGLLQFSIEVLKESDPSAFLQVSGPLINRVENVDRSFNKEMEMESRVSHEFELSLDSDSVLHAVQTLNFFQMKAPGPPQFIPEECSAENNTVTLAWQPHLGSVVDGYTLELDDGNEGDFREVFCGKETMCTVEGLHFDSMYNARVKAFNHAGESDCSECICLQTADVAWFNMDPSTAHPDILFSNDNMTVTCSSYDDRVALGNVGFSRGVHYWEITVDRYDNTPDPAFGIARFDVGKDCMIGKDDKGWSMYIDSKRSWFMHAGSHTDRTEGGIVAGSVIGILLDLNQSTISFYVNEEPHGPIAFTGLHGVFYPAVSVNRNVQVTIHSGLDVPVDSDTEDE